MATALAQIQEKGRCVPVCVHICADAGEYTVCGVLMCFVL